MLVPWYRNVSPASTPVARHEPRAVGRVRRRSGQLYESNGFRRVVFAGETVSFTRRVQYDSMRVPECMQSTSRSWEEEGRKAGGSS